MGRRSEQRIAACLPVILRGIDSNGQPFTQTAQTHDVSASGACLEGAHAISQAGGEITIEYQGRRARFRVVWAGPAGTRMAGWIGVRCLDEGKYIWGLQLAASQPDRFDHDASKPVPGSPAAILADYQKAAGAAANLPGTANAAKVPWAGNERRQFPRVACRIEARVATVGTTLFLPATVTDICLGGCYLEMLSPLAMSAEMELRLGAAADTIRARGRVCSTVPGMGMGVAFTGMSPEDLKKLRQIAPAPAVDAGSPTSPTYASTSHPAASRTQPSQPRAEGGNGGDSGSGAVGKANGSPSGDFALSSPPQFPPTTAEALEAVLRVLFRKGILNQAEISAELQRLKSSR